MQNVTSESYTNGEHFALVLRLQPSASGQPLDSSLRLRAMALVKDVLRSRLDVDAAVTAQDWVHTEGYADLGKALAASRALQLAFEGFRSAAPVGRPNISVLLDASSQGENESAGALIEHKDLLTAAKPAQVLITQRFYDRIAQYQPSLRSSPLRAGVYEFLWTGKERLAELQALPESRPVLAADVVEPRALDETAVYQTIQPGTRSKWKDPEPEAVASEPEAESETLVGTPQPRRSLSPVVATGTAVVMLLLVSFVVYTFLLSGSRTKPASPSKPTVVAQPAMAEKPLVKVAPAEQPLPPTPKPTKQPAPPAFSVGVSPAVSNAKPPRGCSIAGEVPDYLRLADSYRSRGDYQRAITNYNLVLGCEPGNKLALTGKRNAETAEKYASQ